MKNNIKTTSALLLTCFVITGAINAQDKKFQFSAGAGLGVPVWFQNVKKPDYSARLWLEKYVESEKINTIWFAAEYTHLPAAKTKTVPLSQGSTSTVTYNYHSSMLGTLTMGWRKWKENGFVKGIGAGVAVYSQGLPFGNYSDNLLNYNQTEKQDLGWGLACVGHIGYKKKKFQLLATAQSALEPFGSFILSDKEARSSVVLVLGVSAVFSF